MKEYICPNCQAAISLDDVNVAQDIALCRSCGQTSSFSIMANTSAVQAAYPAGQVPKHLTIKSEFMQGAQINYRRISPMILFLLPFTCFWSGMSMYGIYIEPIMETGKLPALTSMLFGLPFLIGSIVLIFINLNMLFGKTVITLKRGKGDVFIGIGPLGWRRKFEYNTQSQIRLIPTNVRINEVAKSGINIITGDKNITFGTTIDDKTKSYIAAKLKELIRTGI